MHFNKREPPLTDEVAYYGDSSAVYPAELTGGTQSHHIIGREQRLCGLHFPVFFPPASSHKAGMNEQKQEIRLYLELAIIFAVYIFIKNLSCWAAAYVGVRHSLSQ